MMNMIGVIKLRLKSVFDSIDNTAVKKNILNALPFWLGAFITGIVAVLYTKLFAYAEMGTKYFFHLSPWLFFIITPLSFLLAWWLVEKYAPFSRGSGIPQVTAALELSNTKNNEKVNKLLSIRVAFIKIVSSVVLIFGGGVAGREGPTIQIAASIFKKINDWLPDWYPKISRKNMIVTGAAAGLAAAFNTPLGGIVFAIEELTKTHFNYFKSALLTGVIIAGLTALNLLGPYLYLGYPKLDNVGFWIILAIIPVAIVTGLLASLMTKFIMLIFNKKRGLKTKRNRALYALACGLVIASLAVLVDERTFGSGKEIMATTLFTSHKHLEWYIPIIRFFGPIITFTSGVAGGVFAPALSTGAAIGAVMSEWMHLSSEATNLIILCGMAGFLTGVTRSPFTSLILVMEMTNDHNIIFYLMVAALLANLVAKLIGKESFYDQLKERFIHEANMEHS